MADVLKIRIIFVVCVLLSTKTIKAQTDQYSPQDTIHTLQVNNSTLHARKWVVGTAQVGLWTGSFLSLNKAWYANYPKSKFHLFNDWKEWQHMDKGGHFWSSYHISHYTSDLWKWAGVKERDAHVLGAVSGLAYLSVVEVLDGYSDKWGFSIPDMASNTLGAATFLLQEMAWHEQRIRFKLSYMPYSYGSEKARANQLFGNTLMERILKDYNSQTYWASVNIKSFFPETNVPSWLNLSAGYGARTMLGGYENKWVDAQGDAHDRIDIPRYKRYYLSLDIDFDRIKTRNKILKKTLHLLNVVKMPAPALEFRSSGGLRLHWLYF